LIALSFVGNLGNEGQRLSAARPSRRFQSAEFRFVTGDFLRTAGLRKEASVIVGRSGGKVALSDSESATTYIFFTFGIIFFSVGVISTYVGKAWSHSG